MAKFHKYEQLGSKAMNFVNASSQKEGLKGFFLNFLTFITSMS